MEGQSGEGGGTNKVAGIVGMNSDGCVTQHGLRSRSSNHDSFPSQGSLNLISERSHDPEFEFLFKIVTGYIK